MSPNDIQNSMHKIPYITPDFAQKWRIIPYFLSAGPDLHTLAVNSEAPLYIYALPFKKNTLHKRKYS